MRRSRDAQRPPSLAQHFDAPDDYIGHFGWMCGYSADTLFLNDAAERFTRLKRSNRAKEGRIALAMVLDPGSPLVSFRDAPGVAHFPIIDHVNRPFRLMHAKVALLGFRHQENRDQWQLRLLVSTGNWTRQTLEESLDLVWRIDIASESLNNADAEILHDCADIKAAWNLLTWIQKRFDTRLLNASQKGYLSETMNVTQQFVQWIAACSQKAQGKPRFFDNRGKSLLSQLPDKVKACSEVKRNYLAMGSGFYETSTERGQTPVVPVMIVESLRKEGLLTTVSKHQEKANGRPKKNGVDIYVNPDACQAIATARESLQDLGITIRPAVTPATVFREGARRTLHAKFLFSANCRDSSKFTSPWVYLGSGNLTNPGFAKAMSVSVGNLEAGVVFTTDSLFWQKDTTAHDNQVVTNLLPIQWDDEIDDATPLSAGSGMEPRGAICVAPPVAWLTWHEIEGVGELRTDEPSAYEIQVLDSAGTACSNTGTGFRWLEAQPRQISIRWQANNQQFESSIPVVDQYGRIAAAELPAIDIDEAWWQLADFPLPPDEDGDGDNENENDENEGEDRAKRRSVPTNNYPIRKMMDLIENIAAKQTGIDEVDWGLWCSRLEQTLRQAGDSTPLKYFRDELKLNPLSPLRRPSFRPSFAETNDSEFGELYNNTLLRIEDSWRVSGLHPLGGTQ